MNLEINQSENLLLVDGQPVQGRHRWETTFLALLVAPVAGTHRDLDMSRLTAGLQRMGQVAVLNRKQISRLIDGLEGMFAALGQSHKLALRLVHAPRKRTVGPWHWIAQTGDQVDVHDECPPPPPITPASGLPSLSAAGAAHNCAALCRRLLVVQALFREGSLAEARDALDEEAAWDGASAELLVWRACRLAESLSKLRDFARAEQVIISAESLVANHRVAASFLGDSVKLLRLRLAYQVNPMNSPFVVLGQLQPVLAGCAQIDRLAVGLAYNLAALCHRRWFESASSQPFSAAGLQHREDALAHGFAAVFCFATAELPNYAEYACANLGYLLSRLYSLRVEDSLVAALEWYGIAQAWHNRYELVDDSVWEYIFLGDLMLYQPHAPQAFKQLTKSVKWDGTPPDTLEFFDLALRRAREIGDPRQLAHSALNLMWFARKNDLRGAADAAAAELLAVFSLHPDLRKLLSEEGYPLPAQNPLRKDKPVHGQQDVHDA